MAKLERADKPVSVLLEELKRGELGFPEIQRSYVWNRPQARDLLDSLYREYPSGLILLWKPQELPELRETSFEFLEVTVHGRFTGSPETKIDQDLRAIVGPSPLDDMIRNLRREIAGLDITPEMIEGKYQRHSFLPLVFVIFRRNQASDWFTGTVLSSTNVGPEHQLEIHHIFPRAVLKQADKYASHEIDDLANIAFLSQKANRTILKSPPNEYLPKVEKERLQAQLIPLDRDFWSADRFRDFLVARRDLLTEAINKYLRELGQEYFDEE